MYASCNKIKMGKLIIRADGNSQIGAGHIMRCLAIAEAAQNIGIECIFVTADDSLSDKIKEFNFKNIILESIYTNLESEIDSFLKIIKEEDVRTVLLDSYYVTDYYLHILHQFVRIAYIDDVFSFPYETDLLINYNIYSTEAKYKALYMNKPLPLLATGIDYIPLRKEFQNIAKRKFNEVVQNILISVGGADPERMAIRIAKALLERKEIYSKYRFHFVIGAFELDKDELYLIQENNNWIVMHENVKKMSELMRLCDIAISAAGSTLYELCSCGVPTVTYILEDNQIGGAEAFEKNGIMLNAGDYRNNTDFESHLLKKLNFLINDFEFRYEVSVRQQNLIDGNGAMRIATKIKNEIIR